jgi:hypothetical protein
VDKVDKGRIRKAIDELSRTRTIRFGRVLTLCKEFFGEPRIAGSHHIFKTPWQGDPRINLQKTKDGKAKKYQVKQVVSALEQLIDESEGDEDGR